MTGPMDPAAKAVMADLRAKGADDVDIKARVSGTEVGYVIRGHFGEEIIEVADWECIDDVAPSTAESAPAKQPPAKKEAKAPAKSGKRVMTVRCSLCDERIPMKGCIRDGRGGKPFCSTEHKEAFHAKKSPAAPCSEAAREPEKNESTSRKVYDPRPSHQNTLKVLCRSCDQLKGRPGGKTVNGIFTCAGCVAKAEESRSDVSDDVQAFLDAGGTIDTLPGPGDGKDSRYVGGRGLGDL